MTSDDVAAKAAVDAWIVSLDTQPWIPLAKRDELEGAIKSAIAAERARCIAIMEEHWFDASLSVAKGMMAPPVKR